MSERKAREIVAREIVEECRLNVAMSNENAAVLAKRIAAALDEARQEAEKERADAWGAMNDALRDRLDAATVQMRDYILVQEARSQWCERAIELQARLDAALEALRAVPWLITALRSTAPATWSGWPIVRDVEKAIAALTPGERAGREGTA